MIYHVSKQGNDFNIGSEENPFFTINKAAQIAKPGDTVIVHEGTYRECVNPKNSGYNNLNRITYTAAKGERPVIKGSEIIDNWENVENTVWKKVLPNSMFGDWNPYSILRDGDWYYGPKEYKIHLGDVYINGVSMFEASSLEDLYSAEIRNTGYNFSLNYHEEIPNPEMTKYRWFAQVDDNYTTILCNFQEYNPNEEMIEINVRRSCFYPEAVGISYITLRGFEIAQAACPWVPPTSDQIGMVGPHWSKGWIIEDNILHDAKCSAISVGKEASTGDNDFTKYHRKFSHYYQTEAVFRGNYTAGWNKENVGSHLIRNNTIYNCGQTAIVGHMGCAFCKIEHNNIYNIGVKHEFDGAEIAGIKFHAAIDTIIENNCIHNCTLGIWLDWQAQGTRVTRNIMFENNRDFMIEVTHGPCLVDNNIMLSNLTLVNMAQGTAFVHNLIYGNVWHQKCLGRQTPYHFPHSTNILGVAPVFCGDDRLINNIILSQEPKHSRFTSLSNSYNDNNDIDKYNEIIHIDDAFIDDPPELPVWLEDNVITDESENCKHHKGLVLSPDFTVSIKEIDGKFYINLYVPENVIKKTCSCVTTERLGAPMYTEQPFENPDGTPITISQDILGEVRETILPGPFANLKAGSQEILLWD
ncbi:MAG: right-handed parallel beta-helix repeat-containing protein [Acutalibacteraceae bacterium]|nr:right-handed parallel beta-helix repeat-containing protein [Acutalibacteraceae bacterium]